MGKYNIDDLIDYLKRNKILEDDLKHHIIKLGNKLSMDQLLRQRYTSYGDIQWTSICVVLTIEKYHNHYKTLLIDKVGHIFMSTKTTKQLMNELMTSLGMKYDEFVEKIKNRQYKVPYVYKHFIILPDGGVTKQNVNWLFLNHLVAFDKHERTDDTVLYFKHLEVHSLINIEYFIKQLQFITSIYYKQLQMVEEWYISDDIAQSYIYQRTLREQKKQQDTTVTSLMKW